MSRGRQKFEIFGKSPAAGDCGRVFCMPVGVERRGLKPLRQAGYTDSERMIVRLILAGCSIELGGFDEKKFLQFMGGYVILKDVVE